MLVSKSLIFSNYPKLPIDLSGKKGSKRVQSKFFQCLAREGNSGRLALQEVGAPRRTYMSALTSWGHDSYKKSKKSGFEMSPKFSLGHIFCVKNAHGLENNTYSNLGTSFRPKIDRLDEWRGRKCY